MFGGFAEIKNNAREIFESQFKNTALIMPLNFIRSFGNNSLSEPYKLTNTFNHYFYYPPADPPAEPANDACFKVLKINKNLLAINIYHIIGIMLACGLLFATTFLVLWIIPGIGLATKVSFIIIFAISLALSKVIYKPTIGEIKQKRDCIKPLIAGFFQFSILNLEIIAVYLIVKVLLLSVMSLFIWALLIFLIVFAIYYKEKKRAETIT